MDDALLDRYVAWMVDRRLSARTIECRVCVVSMLARHIGKPLADATTTDLESWAHWLSVRVIRGDRLMTDSARYTYLKMTAEFYRHLLAAKLIGEDPSAGLTWPQVGRYRPRPIADADLELALAAAVGNDRMFCWLTLASALGLRAVEIAAIERRDVLDTWQPRRLIVHGKGRRERELLLHAVVLATLRPFLMERGRLFWKLSRSGPVSPAVVSQAVNGHLAGLGIDARLHQLRHWCATTALAETHELRVVQELMGHASPTTTAIYAAPDEAQVGPMMDRLARRAL